MNSLPLADAPEFCICIRAVGRETLSLGADFFAFSLAVTPLWVLSGQGSARALAEEALVLGVFLPAA